MRKWPLIASSVSPGPGPALEVAPGGTGPGFAQPLKCESITGLARAPQECLSPRGEAIADLEAFGQAELLELPHPWLEERCLHPERFGQPGREHAGPFFDRA